MKVRIDSEQARQYAIKQLEDCSIDDCLDFVLDHHKSSRSVSQNSLMWMILTDMQKTAVNEYAGSTKEEWHFEMKKEFLVTMFERDDPEYAEMIQSLRDVYSHSLEAEAIHLHTHIVKLTSTTKCDVGQFSEYLECIMGWCNSRGIGYRLPQDIYDCAMGVK